MVREIKKVLITGGLGFIGLRLMPSSRRGGIRFGGHLFFEDFLDCFFNYLTFGDFLEGFYGEGIT